MLFANHLVLSPLCHITFQRQNFSRFTGKGDLKEAFLITPTHLAMIVLGRYKEKLEKEKVEK